MLYHIMCRDEITERRRKFSYTWLATEEIAGGVEGPVEGLVAAAAASICPEVVVIIAYAQGEVSGVPVPHRTNQREFAADDPPDAKRTATLRHCVNHV